MQAKLEGLESKKPSTTNDCTGLHGGLSPARASAARAGSLLQRHNRRTPCGEGGSEPHLGDRFRIGSAVLPDAE